MRKLKIKFSSKKKQVKIKMKTRNGDLINFKYDIHASSIESPELSKAMTLVETLRKR